MPKKTRSAKSANLPPFPWATTGAALGGKPVRLARPGLERAELVEGARRGEAGAYEIETKEVWRIRTSPAIRFLAPHLRAALLDYAEAQEKIFAKGGVGEITGAPSTPACANAGPSHHALIAAEHLRAMKAALQGSEVLRAGKGLRQHGRVAVRHVDLIEWVVCEHLDRPQILAKLGLPQSSQSLQKACAAAIARAAEALAEFRGYRPKHIAI